MKAALLLVLVAAAASQAYANCLNQAGVSLIKGFEGFRPKQYLDVAGIPTIGYGTLCRTGTLKCPGPVTEAAAAAELGRSISAKYAPCVINSVKNPLNNNQFSALVSFAYNAGCGALQNVVTATGGKVSSFPSRMVLYNKATVKGRLQVVQGLVNRRAAEIALFQKAADSPCALAPTLRSSAPAVPGVAPAANAAAAAPTPGAEFPVHPPVNFAAPSLAPATDGRVFAEGEDTGNVVWVKDRPASKRKMKMGKLAKKGKGKGSKPKPVDAPKQAAKKKKQGSKAERV